MYFALLITLKSPNQCYVINTYINILFSFKVLKLLELVRQYCDLLRDILAAGEGRGGGNSRDAAHQAGCKRVTIQVQIEQIDR